MFDRFVQLRAVVCLALQNSMASWPLWRTPQEQTSLHRNLLQEKIDSDRFAALPGIMMAAWLGLLWAAISQLEHAVSSQRNRLGVVKVRRLGGEMRRAWLGGVMNFKSFGSQSRFQWPVSDDTIFASFPCSP